MDTIFIVISTLLVVIVLALLIVSIYFGVKDDQQVQSPPAPDLASE